MCEHEVMLHCYFVDSLPVLLALLGNKFLDSLVIHGEIVRKTGFLFEFVLV